MAQWAHSTRFSLIHVQRFLWMVPRKGIPDSQFKVRFTVRSPPLLLLIANDKLIIIYWMGYLFFHCFLIYCLTRKFVVKTIFTALKNGNKFIFLELQPEVTIFSAAEFSLKFTKDLCLHWFIVALGKTTQSV